MALERLAATHSQSQIEYESTKTAQLCLITVNSTRALTNKTNHDLTLINNQNIQNNIQNKYRQRMDTIISRKIGGKLLLDIASISYSIDEHS